MCALKTALAEVKICGPSGDPHAPLEVSRYTKVPWAIIDAEDRPKDTNSGVNRSRTSRWQLADENAAIGTCHHLDICKQNLHHFYSPWLQLIVQTISLQILMR